MKTIYLIRHSAPFIEIENYIDYKNVSWDEYNRNMILSSIGENNAKKLCDIEELNNVSSIYSSDSYRAIGTAKYIADKNSMKIRLDPRINERNLGCKTISELPDEFSAKSFVDKNLKYGNGESLNEVDKRFYNFLNEIINGQDNKIVLVIHGMILMSYLQSICEFEFNSNVFKINFNNKEVMNRKFKNPDIFKIEIEKGEVSNVTNIELEV